MSSGAERKGAEAGNRGEGQEGGVHVCARSCCFWRRLHRRRRNAAPAAVVVAIRYRRAGGARAKAGNGMGRKGAERRREGLCCAVHRVANLRVRCAVPARIVGPRGRGGGGWNDGLKRCCRTRLVSLRGRWAPRTKVLSAVASCTSICRAIRVQQPSIRRVPWNEGTWTRSRAPRSA